MTGNRPKLLFVSNCIPDPVGTGAEQRAFSFLSAYAKRMDVELWYHPRPDNPETLRMGVLAPLCTAAIPYYPELVLQEGQPLNLLLKDRLRKSDYVHVRKLPVALRHRRILWDIDELPWTVRDPGRASILHPDARKAEEQRWERYRSFSKRCSVIFASSPVETHPELGGVKVVPNWYRPSAIKRDADKSTTLLFVGSLSYPPNVSAITHYLREIGPRMPGATLRVIGRRPVEAKVLKQLEEWARSKLIEVFFDVESCSPHYAVAAAAIVPLIYGAGTRLKILEAFGHRCPVVSTSKGCEGLPVRDEVELLIRDDATEFANACVQLVETKELQERLAANAMKYVEEHHAQAIVERALFQSLAEAGIAL